MKRDAIVLVRSIYRANKAKDKTEYLEAFLDDFELNKFCSNKRILKREVQFFKQGEKVYWSVFLEYE